MALLGISSPGICLALVILGVTSRVQCAGSDSTSDDCFYFEGYVTCSRINRFPTSFPADTTSVSISKMAIEEIPANAFRNLPYLESVVIHGGNISRIASDAFRGLLNVDSITFYSVDIGVIEEDAFVHLSDIGSISFYMSNIGTIESHAFSSMVAVDEISLFALNITTVKQFAFYNLDYMLDFKFYTNNVQTMESRALYQLEELEKLDMYLNNFQQLGCGTVEPLIATSRQSAFYSNSVPCNCRIAWVVKNDDLEGHRFSNWCTMPGSGKKVYFDQLSHELLGCDKDSDDAGCTKFGPNAEIVATKESNLAPSSTPIGKQSVSTKLVGANYEPTLSSSSTQLKLSTILKLTRTTAVHAHGRTNALRTISPSVPNSSTTDHQKTKQVKYEDETTTRTGHTMVTNSHTTAGISETETTTQPTSTSKTHATENLTIAPATKSESMVTASQSHTTGTAGIESSKDGFASPRIISSTEHELVPNADNSPITRKVGGSNTTYTLAQRQPIPNQGNVDSPEENGPLVASTSRQPMTTDDDSYNIKQRTWTMVGQPEQNYNAKLNETDSLIGPTTTGEPMKAESSYSKENKGQDYNGKSSLVVMSKDGKFSSHLIFDKSGETLVIRNEELPQSTPKTQEDYANSSETAKLAGTLCMLAVICVLETL